MCSFSLAEFETEEDLEEAIWALPKNGGNTNTAEGLRHAQQIIEETARDSVKVCGHNTILCTVLTSALCYLDSLY